jgi:chromosome segregation ATPase
MQPIIDRLEHLKDRVNSLLKEHKGMQAKVTELEHGIREHQRTEEVLKARVGELEKENEVLRNAKAEHEAAVPGAKDRIDELVQEIDRCLELIQN